MELVTKCCYSVNLLCNYVAEHLRHIVLLHNPNVDEYPTCKLWYYVKCT